MTIQFKRFKHRDTEGDIINGVLITPNNDAVDDWYSLPVLGTFPLSVPADDMELLRDVKELEETDGTPIWDIFNDIILGELDVEIDGTHYTHEYIAPVLMCADLKEAVCDMLISANILSSCWDDDFPINYPSSLKLSFDEFASELMTIMENSPDKLESKNVKFYFDKSDFVKAYRQFVKYGKAIVKLGEEPVAPSIGIYNYPESLPELPLLMEEFEAMIEEEV